MFWFDHTNFYKAKLPFSDSSSFWGSRRNWGHSEGEEAPSLSVVYKQRLAFAWIIVCSCGDGWLLFYILLDCIHVCVLKMKMHVDNHKRWGAVGKSEGDFFLQEIFRESIFGCLRHFFCPKQRHLAKGVSGHKNPAQSLLIESSAVAYAESTWRKGCIFLICTKVPYGLVITLWAILLWGCW